MFLATTVNAEITEIRRDPQRGIQILRDEADLLMKKCRLPELLADYPSWFIGGSYNYGLMCWRDLDVYVLDPQHDLRKCFEIGYELTRRLSATKSRVHE